MLDLLLPTYNFNLTYAQKLAADVPDDQMCAQPVPGRVMNHPAFVLGHLAWASDNGLKLLGQEPALTGEWKELVIMGAKPLADRSRYPAKDLLLKALESAHARLAAAVATAAPEVFAQPAPERMRARFPTVGNMLLGLMTAHEASHLGQFSAWRRAMGFPSVF
jgi:DinB superfamily